MIPKKIHYVWVGDQEKPASVLACIASWKTHLPDYEIIEWGNEKHEEIKNRYSEEAFKNKKWAFVSDYIRIYALYHFGGIYLDTDVNVSNSFDPFLMHDFFSCHEIYNGKVSPITTAVMGASAHNEIMRDLFDAYNQDSFEKPQGLNQQTNTSRFTNYFAKKFNLKAPYSANNRIELRANNVIYPSYYFCVPQPGEINYASHEFNASWQDGYQRRIKLRIGQYRLVRFKKNMAIESRELPLAINERIIVKLNTSKTKVLALIKAQ